MLVSMIQVLVPVLFVLLLGYFAGRKREFDTVQVAGINELTLNFALPASLFVGIVDIPRATLLQDGGFVLAVVAALIGIYLIALIVGGVVLRLNSSAAALFALGAGFPGTPFFGPAVLGGLFGQSSALAVASTAIVANLILVPLSVVILEAAAAGQGSRRRSAASVAAVAVPVGTGSADPVTIPDYSSRQPAMSAVVVRSLSTAVKRPYVWAPVIGLVLVLSGVQVPSLIDAMLNLIGQTTSGLSLFVSGLMLAAYSVKLNAAVAINAALKSLVLPVLMFVLVVLLGVHGPLIREAVVAAALPSAVIAPMLAAQYKTYQSEAGSSMVLTIVLMMVVVPIFFLIIH
jgi:malonate transporter and related proteins